MSFSDLFTSDMLSRVTAVSVTDMVISVVFSFLLGLFIFYVYRKTFNGVMYSASFGLTLIGMCMIAAILILAVSSNIVLSLGMVGALSIVRFRTAIKEPLDIVFLFWSMSAGIVLATGMIPLAVFGSIAVGVVLLVFANRSAKDDPYLLVIHCDGSDAEEALLRTVEENTVRHVIKGRTFSRDGKEEITVEVQLRDGQSGFVRQLSAADGVEDVVMVSYNGDYMQ